MKKKTFFIIVFIVYLAIVSWRIYHKRISASVDSVQNEKYVPYVKEAQAEQPIKMTRVSVELIEYEKDAPYGLHYQGEGGFNEDGSAPVAHFRIIAPKGYFGTKFEVQFIHGSLDGQIASSLVKNIGKLYSLEVPQDFIISAITGKYRGIYGNQIQNFKEEDTSEKTLIDKSQLN